MMSDGIFSLYSLNQNTFAYTIGCVTLILAYSWNRNRRAFPCAVPFPFNQYILSHLLYLYIVVSKFYGGDLAAHHRAVRRRLGNIFFQGPLFGQPHNCPVISVNHPDDQAAILRKEKDLEWVVNLPDTATAIEGERNFQNMSSGSAAHSSLRKVYSSLISPKSLEQFTTTIIEYFHKLWNELDGKEDEVKIQHAIREAQMKLMCKILYGFGEETEEDRQILHDFHQDFVLTEKALFAFGGTSSKVFKDGLEAKKRISKILNQKFDSIFEQRIAQIKQQDAESGKGGNKDYDVIDVIGSAMDQIVEGLIKAGCTGKDSKGDNSEMSYLDAQDNLYLLLEASHITTMTVTSSMMFFLNHPDNKESLERARSEVSAIEPTYESLKGFSFGHACIQEALRLAPIVGTVGYMIPKGKSFKIREETIHGPIVLQFQSSSWYQDEEVFENADSFVPERWLPGEKAMTKFAKSTFHPFGFGRHICLGYPLAMLVMNANLYCFFSNTKRSIEFDEKKVKVKPGLFPEKQVCDGFVGKVVVNNNSI